MARTLEQTIRLNKIKDGAFFFFVYSGIVVFCLLILYPFYYILINSLNAQLVYGPVMLWPEQVNLSNYAMVLSDPKIVWSITLSVIRVGVGGALGLAVNSMCAFVLRRRALKFRNFYLVFLLIPMFFQGGLIPVYLNLRMLGLLNTFFVFIFPSLFSFFYVLILMTCFGDIPDEVEDSAKMDGAGYFTIYAKIYVPMSIPVMATILLFISVNYWQIWFDSLYFTTKESLQTFAAFLMLTVRRFTAVGSDTSQLDEDNLLLMANLQGTRFSAMIISVLPVLAIYPFIQKYFVKGIKLGSVKG